MSVQSARGMRDFLPAEARRRRAMQRRVEAVFERYGFEPLITPGAERIETLTGKYGEEGDQLLFKILKRGEGSERGETDMGLRYDLTVPLARVVAMYGSQLAMPFKRYQIDSVWRADRPQKGRYREFVQCDVDIVGTASLGADAELVAVAHDCFEALGLSDYRLRVNHRQALRALVLGLGAPIDREPDVLVALDKLDKIGRDGVLAELEQRGFAADTVRQAGAFLDAVATGAPGSDLLREWAGGTDAGRQALAELVELGQRIEEYGVPAERWEVDPTLARGLSYYTGPVFEATLPGFLGSVAGGGRYDGLVGMFSGRDVPATGLSLGFERLVVVLEERGTWQATSLSLADAAVLPFGDGERAAAVDIAQLLRREGLRVWLPPEPRKMAKMLKSVHAMGIGSAVIVGSEEVAQGKALLKNLASGEQVLMDRSELSGAIRLRLASEA